MLDTAEHAFRLLTCDPAPLALAGERIGFGLADGAISLVVLRDLVMARRLPAEGRRRLWRLLAANAQQAGPSWVVGAVGMAIPGLRQVAGRLSMRAGRCGCAYYTADVDAEILAGFVAGLRAIDPDGEPEVFGRLMSAAYNAGRRTLRGEVSECGHRHLQWPAGSVAPPVPVAHPDVVLARAVDSGVLSAREATVIGATRLDGLLLREVAAETGESVEALKRRRQRAEKRLVAAIGDGRVSWP
ncbi:MAG: sigma-70 family RNA polymerase sigma factor [Mycobacterium sp.]|nr:sigma-70 family RNA polymerase sigma factor [Mycobacterium sp.]